MNTKTLIMDVRRQEKKNILIIILFFPLYMLFYLITNLNYSGVTSLLFAFVFYPAIRLAGIKCPNCLKNFYKPIYFVMDLNKEKERTKCCHCSYEPDIYSDFLETDVLTKKYEGQTIDLRNIEKKIFTNFFIAAFIIQLAALTTFLILPKTSLKDRTFEIMLGFLSFYLIGCFFSISSGYRTVKCSVCGNAFFRGYFGFIKARNLIKTCACSSCGKGPFLRSYLTVTAPYSKIEGLNNK